MAKLKKGKVLTSPADNYQEKSMISHKFIEALNKLIQLRRIKDYQSFAQSYGYDKSTISNIKSGKQDVPISLLFAFVTDYHLNPAFFFGKSIELTWMDGSS